MTERHSLDAVAVDDLRRLLELLAAEAVEPFVFAHEQIVRWYGDLSSSAVGAR